MFGFVENMESLKGLLGTNEIFPILGEVVQV